MISVRRSIASSKDMDIEKDEGESRLDFSDLNIPNGAALAIEIPSASRKHTVRLIGYDRGRSILISAPQKDGKEILIDKHATVAVRFLDGKRACAFESKVIYRSIQPYSYYHLAYPTNIEAQQIRSSERVDTEIEAEIDSDFNIVRDWPKPAKVTNLSRTGAKLSSYESLGEFGHELIINFSVIVSGIEKAVSLNGIVRNVDIDEGGFGQEDRFIVGVQFLEMNDEARLTLANYIYEHN